MRISIQKRKRIPLLFFFGIGFPCVLLGYLALRGIQNDQALMEKEQLHEKIWNKYYGKEAQEKLINYINHLIQEEGYTEEQIEQIQTNYWLEYNAELSKNGLELDMIL